MYALYNTARCVNTAGYINLGLHSIWLTNHSYVSNVTYMIKIGKHFAKTQHGKLDGYLADINIFYT
jgi:hypothetical protein